METGDAGRTAAWTWQDRRGDRHERPRTRTWRRATAEDAVALRDLERIASQTGLAHVFGELPYPDDDVLARWALLLDDPDVTVEVVEDDRGWWPSPPTTAPRCATWPSAPTTGAPAWGARAFLRAEAAGARRLWVLEANGRARRLYESLGWTPER